MAMLSISDVPKSLAAKTRQGLRRLMLLENARYQVGHKFFDFYYDPKEKMHVCWFHPLVGATIQEQQKAAEEIINEAN